MFDIEYINLNYSKIQKKLHFLMFYIVSVIKVVTLGYGPVNSGFHMLCECKKNYTVTV